MEKLECEHCGKKFGSETALEQHMKAKHPQPIRKKKISLKKILIPTSVALVILIGFFVSSNRFSLPGKYDAFAQCLTEKGVTMYGAYWCPHCTNQKRMFGNSWKFVNYVECAPDGKNAQPELCRENGITGYPTWIFNNERREGEQSLLSLSDWSDCPLG